MQFAFFELNVFVKLYGLVLLPNLSMKKNAKGAENTRLGGDVREEAHETCAFDTKGEGALLLGTEA